MTIKPILISGGGLASLLLAQSLRVSKIPFLVFERDSSMSSRAQGYRLRLSAEGLSAIESVLDVPLWQKFYDACGKTDTVGLSVYNAVTGEHMTSSGPDKLTSREGKVFGVARGDMRKLFAEGCEDFMQWGKNVKGYELTDDGVKAVFADGTRSVEGSMLVGGEGIYSHVARQLSGGKIKTYDLGARGIHGQAPTTAFKALGEGVFRLLDTSRPEGSVSVITNVRAKDMDDPNAMFGWTLSGQPGIIRPPNDDFTIVGRQAADLARDLTKNWHTRFKPLFEQMDVAEAAFWKITCSTPTGVPDWPNEPRVTIIGDAAHSMTPAGGNGANTAVQDSALLGRLLREAGGYKDGVSAEYEKEMREYASAAVRHSYNHAVSVFGVKIDENSKIV
ncbi:hypothetical protein P8C59_005505 [Phyllachora maydis]|uniref:FAD-binding domain-containing protein n=1 Tax=Phyllachora maydis TaxID=1825666 RepID=A0AAD9I5P0_9PEZI|nr:hypothetical protein P8C59_005505 [Phyllachora maydis]